MRQLATALILLAITLPLGGVAAAQEVQVAFVNTARILEEAPQAQGAKERLEKEFAPRDSEISATQRELKSLEEKLQRDGAVMAAQGRRDLERDILMRQRELQRSREAFTEDLNLRRNEEFARLQREVAQAIVDIAKRDGYDLIFESGVVYASDKVDITDKVIADLRQRAKGGGN